ncbi:GNAT family N-acetyltransferase [Candidatus Sumerlaeota bacterium]|nr:GNAT family N-acetyltransferase [Candidatus Sumerlaeota bacterium]
MIHELTEADLAEMTDICAKSLDLEPHPWTPALVREKTLGAHDFDAALLLGYEIAGEVRGFTQAVARDHAGERRGWVRLMAVNPAWQRQGIGSALLSEVERRLAERGVTRIGFMDVPANYLTPGVDFQYTAAACFLTKHGYHVTHTNLNLMCGLTSDEFEDVDEDIVGFAQRGITVRRAEEGDREAIAAWARREFAGWEEEILACYEQSPISLWIALRGEEMLGFGAYDSNNVNTGHFGPTGLSEASRGLGLGRVLTRAALRDQRRQGHRRAVIPWVGPIRFYSKCCGAWTDRIFWAFEKPLRG